MREDTILVIDDNPKIIQSISMILKEHSIVGFQDGDQALEYLTNPNSISLIFLDVYMKGVSGLDLLPEIKKIAPDIPVMMMSAFGSMDIVIEALRGHADDFIEKPFEVKSLREKTREIFRLELRKKRQGSRDEKVEQIKRFTSKNLSNVSLEAISSELCLSSKYISRMFNQKSEASFRNYKVGLKMQKAKEWLEESSLSVNEISARLGYQNAESFMRIFKKQNKCTPSQYREKMSGSTNDNQK